MTGFSLENDVAIVVVRVAALSTLQGDDRKRAIALALTREFGVRADAIHFAFATLAPDDPDAALVAYAAQTNVVRHVDLSWVKRVADGTVIWLRNAPVPDNDTNAQPESWLLSDQGAIALDASSNLVEAKDSQRAVPPALMALAADRARAQKPLRVLLVNEPMRAHSGPSEAATIESMLAHWAASLGATFERGELRLLGATSRLEPAPIANASQAEAGINRALNVALAASVMCVLFAAARWVSTPDIPPVTASAPTRAGELWYRATAAAPELSEHTRDATYAGGAWLIVAPSLPPTSIDRVASALRGSALMTQAVREPELRLRVQAP
jgi:hypothetical protein